VVVITISAYGNGEGMTPAAMSPLVWAMSASRMAPTESQIFRNLEKSTN
jgi:hypothetical protein